VEFDLRRGEAGTAELGLDSPGIVQAIVGGEDFAGGAAGAEAADIEFVEPVGGELGGEAGVIEAIGSLEEEKTARLENSEDFAVAGQRRGEMLGDVIVKDDVEGIIGEGQVLGGTLVTFVEVGIGEDRGVGVNAHVTSDAVAKVEMILPVLTGAGTDFED
jgi:hypothetical protein